MADTTKNTYRYIDTDIDRDLLLKNLKHNAQSFVKYNNWDEARANAFYDALGNYEKAIGEGRISTDQDHSLIDSAGQLDNGPSDYEDRHGNFVSREVADAYFAKHPKGDKYQLKFYPNRYVANFVNSIAGGLYKHQQEEANKPKTKFDFDANGLDTIASKYLFPGGEPDYDAWYANDAYDDKAKRRSTINRANLFSKSINHYINDIPNNLDFSDTKYKTREAYIDALHALQTEMANGGVGPKARALMNNLGMDPSIYNRLFTTDKTYVEPTEGGAAPAAQPAADSTEGMTDKQKAEAAKQAELGKQKTAQEAQAARDAAALKKGLLDLGQEIYNNWHTYEAQHYSGNKAYGWRNRGHYISYDTSDPTKLLESYKRAINSNGMTPLFYGNNSALMQGDLSQSVNNDKGYHSIATELGQFISLSPSAKTVVGGKWNGWKYLPNYFNPYTGSVPAYNPVTGYVRRISLYDTDVTGRNLYFDKIKAIYNKGKQNEAQQDFNTGDYAGYVLKKEGGTIEYQQGGGINLKDASLIEVANPGFTAITNSAKTAVKNFQSNPQNRKPFGNTEHNTFNVGWTSADYARLGAIGADIAALVDPEAISATGLGLASSGANLYADLKDGVSTGAALGNFAANTGLSLLGAIPIVGDALGSGTKIIRTVTKYIPKLGKVALAAGAAGVLSNAGEYTKSLNKIGKPGPENEMTVQDWRNIGTLITLALGGSNVYRTTRAAKQARNGFSTSAVRVHVTNKNGENKTLLFTGKKDVEALKKAKDVKAVNDVIHSHNSYQDYDVLSNSVKTGTQAKEGVTGWKSKLPWNREAVKTDKIKPGAVRETEYLDFAGLRQKYGRLYRFNGAVKAAQNRADIIDDVGLPTATVKPAPSSTSAPEPVPTHEPVPTPKASTPKPAPVVAQEPRGQSAPDQVTPQFNPAETARRIMNPHGFRITPTNPKTGKPLTKEDLENIVQMMKENPNDTRQIYQDFFANNFFGIKYQKKGGKFLKVRQIAKAQWGVNTNEFKKQQQQQNQDSIFGQDGKVDWNKATAPLSQQADKIMTNAGIQYSGPRNYGTGYSPYLFDTRGSEYGSSNPVNIIGIKNARNNARDTNLWPTVNRENSDYTNAQKNTDVARAKWQAIPGAREVALLNYASKWLKDNPNGTIDQMIANYNSSIDSMYQYKHDMSLPENSGENAYRHGQEVTNFNRTHRSIYSTANDSPVDDSPEHKVFGYSEKQESWNGGTTAQRGIDITDQDVIPNLEKYATPEQADVVKFLGQIVKDPTGRLYSKTPASPNSPSTLSNPEDGTPSGPKKTKEVPEQEKTPAKSPLNIAAEVRGLLPNMLAFSRYLAARNHNKQQLDIARRLPTLLKDPKEDQLWVMGNQTAVQNGYANRGNLQHMASIPVTSSGEQYTAGNLEAAMKGNDYVSQGYDKDWAAQQDTRNRQVQQEMINHDNRWQTAMTNRTNIFNKQVSDLQALAAYKRANYESLNGLLAQFEQEARNKQVENQATADALNKSNIQNAVTANLSQYGVMVQGAPATEADQQLVNDIMTGKKKSETLTDDERNRYMSIMSAIKDKSLQLYYKSRGFEYHPFAPTGGTGYTPAELNTEVASARQGGVFGDPEKVAIQKLRGRVKKLEIFQNAVKDRMKNYQKDQDRSVKTARDYIRGMKTK